MCKQAKRDGQRSSAASLRPEPVRTRGWEGRWDTVPSQPPDTSQVPGGNPGCRIASQVKDFLSFSLGLSELLQSVELVVQPRVRYFYMHVS